MLRRILAVETKGDVIKEDIEIEAVNEVVFSAGKTRNDWQFFTSHGLVLISVLNNPGRTVREIGLELNLTDRAVSLALADLVADGYITRERIGRRTYYHVNEDHSLRYPVSIYPSEGGEVGERPHLTVKALRAENLATHAPASNPTPISGQVSEGFVDFPEIAGEPD